MLFGFETALSEITLVFFTTLAPSGTAAFIIIALYLIVCPLTSEERARVNAYLFIPQIVSLVGLVLSATHLGNPANALYVLMGVGRSPLSNEVFSAVFFLMLLGTYWLYSFSKNQRIILQKIWLAVTVVAAFVFITTVAFAYSVETIITWNTVYTPLGLWLNALIGGPLLALLTLQFARAPYLERTRFPLVLCGLALFACVLNIVTLILQGIALQGVGNSLIAVAELVPFYSVVVIAFAVFCLVGIGFYVMSLRKSRLPGLSSGILACVLVFIGIFVTRFTFYMMHMTVGLGI